MTKETNQSPNWTLQPYRVPVTIEEVASKKAWRKTRPTPTDIDRAKAIIHDIQVREMAEFSTNKPIFHELFCEYNLDPEHPFYQMYFNAYLRLNKLTHKEEVAF